jgi:hypothetical protein
MSTLTFPSERFPAPPSVSLDIPEDWEPVSVPAVALAARETGEHTEFTPNVIVRVGTRPGLDQPADALMELAGSLEGRPNATIGTPEPVEVGGTSFHRCEVSWSDPRGVAITQVHLFAGLPREDGLQDFVHLTGSVGGSSAEADLPQVEKILDSVSVTR